jgi:hypothetical protein
VPWSEFGITDAQRRHAQRVLKPIRHGTNGGYHAHRARGEAACQACKRAHAAYNRRTERRASA